jgi:Uma2 family endonuclease
MRKVDFATDAPELFRLDTDRYHRMIDAGILREDDKVELLNGLLVQQMPQGINHRYTIELLAELLLTRLGSAFSVPTQLPIQLADGTEPEPDLVVTLPRSQRGRGHPTADQVFLVVEIAESSLKTDRTDKLAIYARAELSDYWIVNLIDKQIEVHTDPSGNGYQTIDVYRAGDSIPLMIDGKSFAPLLVDEVLP